MCTHMPPRTRVCVHVCMIIHRHVGIRVCSVHTPTLTHAPSHLPLHTCVHTPLTYPHPDTCSTHVHAHRHAGGNFPPPSPHSPTSPRRPDCWRSCTRAPRVQVLPGRCPRAPAWGASHTPAAPAGASVCAAAAAGPQPRSQRGGGRKSHAGGAGCNWP